MNSQRMLLVFVLILSACAHRRLASNETDTKDPSFSNVRQDLISLYPDLSPVQMDQRASHLRSSFRFLRAYVPYYYWLVSQNKSQLPETLNAALKQEGWCLGDAHPENFGALIQPSSKSVFTIDDIDDSGPCPLALDALRFFVAARFADPSIDLNDLLQHYLASLGGQEEHFSKFTESLIEDSEDGGVHISKKVANNSQTHLVLEQGMQSATKADRDELQSIFEKIRGPETQILDVAWSLRMEGGSGGLRRYLVLFEDQGKDIKFPRTVELKEIRRPGIFPVATSTIPGDSQRYMKTLLLTQGKSAIDAYQVVTFQKKSYWVRPKWKGSQGVSIDDIDPDTLDSVIKDEAGILGSLHRKSAQEPQKFLAAMSAVPLADWNTSTRTVTKWFESAYSALKAAR